MYIRVAASFFVGAS